MNTIKYISHNEEETKKIANSLAKLLQKGDIIILSGDLGAGKTKFTEGILSFFGLEDEISSPTFNIVNEYKTNDINLYHFDIYRLEDIDEFYEIGGEEYFEKGICIIEWGELLNPILPKDYILIKIEPVENNINSRLFNIQSHGSKFDNYLKILEKEVLI